MKKNIRKQLDIVEKAASDDPQYRQMLMDMRAIERKYNAVLSTFSAEEQNAVCDFVSQCEEMSWRMLELACGLIKESPPD